MSAIIQMSIDVTKIDKSKLKDGKYLNVNISVNDETKYDNNVSMCYNQTKEERESGAAKLPIIGNGKEWSNENSTYNGTSGAARTTRNIPRAQPQPDNTPEGDDIPF